MEWIDWIEALLYVLVEENGTVLSAAGRDGYWTFRLLFADRDALSRTYDHCEHVGLSVDVERIYNLDKGQQGRFGLTAKQQNVLELAHEYGYYNIPRETSAENLGAEIGVSHQALSERLRRAHSSLIGSTIIIGQDGGDDGWGRP